MFFNAQTEPPGFKSGVSRNVFCAAVTLIAGLLSISAAIAQPKMGLEFRSGRQFQGNAHRAVFDRSGRAWIATPNELLRVDGTSVTSVDSSGGTGRRLVLAPGGERYAWLTNSTASLGRFTIELFDVRQPGVLKSKLSAPGLQGGFTTLHIGSRAQLLTGVTPQQDIEGLRGPFHYMFWTRDGNARGSFLLDEPRLGIVDEAGTAIVLLGESNAVAYRNDGTHLWDVSGHFRKGVIADNGQIALLNPADRLNELHVIQGGIATVVKLPEPVHELAVRPDGALAAVATGAGRLAFIDVGTCAPSGCKFRYLPSLQIPGTYYITAVRFIDSRKVVIGVARSVGRGPDAKFFAGEVLVVTTSGHILYQAEISLPQPATWSPQLDVAFGSPYFAAYTPSAVIFQRAW